MYSIGENDPVCKFSCFGHNLKPPSLNKACYLHLQVNSAASAQDIRIYLQLPSLCLSWQNIKETISTALTASFLGYPFVVPGHINDCDPIKDISAFQSYVSTSSSSSSRSRSPTPPPSFAASHPDLTKELYTRWMQISAFFPVMQFSIPPWHYENRKTIAIAKCMIEQVTHLSIDQSIDRSIN